MPDKELARRDMYGHPIIPIGDSGYGVSVSFFSHSDGNGTERFPYFSIFHESDGFRQSLTSLTIDEDNRGWVCNVFRDRTAEVFGE